MPPVPTLPPEADRESARLLAVEVDPRLLASRAALAPPRHHGDVRLALGLSAGSSAAWALFHDLYRPLLLAAARDGDDAARDADAVYRELYERRADDGWHGSFARFDGRSTLAEHVAAVAAERLGKGFVPEPRSVLELLRAVRTGGAGTGGRPGHILNLPALLVLVFCLVIVPVVLLSVRRPGAGVDELRRARITELVRSGALDDAVRLLATDPPPGLERLRPLWPQLRRERLARLAGATPILQPLRLLAPRGRVDDARPRVRFLAAAGLGDVLVRVVAEETGAVLYERVAREGVSEVALDADLPRGVAYGVELRALGARAAGDRETFQVLAEEERARIEREIQGQLEGLRHRAAFAFVAAHAYRANDCLAASLAAFRLLAAEHPESTYAAEEEALILADLGLVPEAVEKARALAKEPVSR